MNGRFDLAARRRVSAPMVLDSLDGRVARMTNTQSAFGEQMDSLSDMVSFGAAPALIAYDWSLTRPGPLGLDRRIRVLRLRRAAAGAFQRQHGRGRQALVPGPAIARGGGPGGRLYLADDRRRASARRRGATPWTQITWVTLHAVCGPHHGDQRAVLQLQGRADEEAACRSR